ncbi:MAG: hypothetical protein K0U98_12740 [Deltaproteobacteria bacterium]|nr:hypothetical protein [Deltaproteobacteria bacterium]
MTKPPVTPERLLELIEGMSGQPILMLVDLVADRFITGTPKRISREAPVLILSFQHETLTPGGGANAVANIRALGGNPLPLGIVGNDPSGTALLAKLEQSEISTAGILVRPGFRTPTKTRILGGGRHSIKQQIVRYDIEEQIELTAAERASISAHLDSLGGKARIAVLSDYGYGAVEPTFLPSIRRAVSTDSQQPGTVLCDSRYRLADFSGLDGATPNEEEAETLLGRSIGDDQRSVLAGGQRLLELLQGESVLITRGSRGMALFNSDGAWQLPVHGTDQVADVTGAGDTVIGTYALALAAGASTLEATCLANYAGGTVVMKMGTATLCQDELRQAVLANPSLLEDLEWAEY